MDRRAIGSGVAAAALAAFLAACAGDEEAERLTFDYRTVEGAQEVIALADERCDATNGGDAWLVESDREPVGYRVTFVCL